MLAPWPDSNLKSLAYRVIAILLSYRFRLSPHCGEANFTHISESLFFFIVMIILIAGEGRLQV